MFMKYNSADLIPAVKRARNYRLYTVSGKKILDFNQDGGRALLGSTPERFSQTLKNEISRGTYSGYPSRYRVRTMKALERLAGTGEISWAGVFSCVGKALDHISAVEGRLFSVSDRFPDARLSCSNDAEIPVWYPFSGRSFHEYLEKYRFVIPLVPFPGSFAPVNVVSSRPGIEKSADDFQVSHIQLAGNIRSIFLLLEYMEKDPYSFWESGWRQNTGKVEKIWKKTGPYLVPVYGAESHYNIFKAFLNRGILISLEHCFPSVLPGELSEGGQKAFFRAAEIISEEYC